MSAKYSKSLKSFTASVRNVTLSIITFMAKKLLVADDSLTIQKVIKLALSGDGYEIQTVSDGTECLHQISLFRPDVVLVDIGLPGRSAFDLKKAANEDPEMSRIPFVLMSSAFEKVDEAKVALLRFDGRLTKPFDPSNLKGVLTAALQMNSGQTQKNFTPSAAPSTGFSLAPSEKSKQTPRPPSPPIDNDITGEIRLMDPKGVQTNPFQSSLQSPPKMDSIWGDTPAAPDLSSDDSDIRNLTESTVKMSGLDDLGGWNIEENSKSMLPPIPNIFPESEPSFSEASLSLELGPGPTFETSARPPSPPKPSHSAPLPHVMDFDPHSVSPSSSASLEGIVERQVREQLEILVQGAVKTQLEQMARKALPEITERVVKSEIRKLLEGLSNSGD